jgi:hypothetical protein
MVHNLQVTAWIRMVERKPTQLGGFSVRRSPVEKPLGTSKCSSYRAGDRAGRASSAMGSRTIGRGLGTVR